MYFDYKIIVSHTLYTVLDMQLLRQTSILIKAERQVSQGVSNYRKTIQLASSLKLHK